MSANQTVRNALIDMGVEPARAHEAALRYQTVEPAVNWVFGDGETWRPPSPEANVPLYYESESSSAIDDGYTADDGDADGSVTVTPFTTDNYPSVSYTAPPPRPILQSNNPFQSKSKNPFRNNAVQPYSTIEDDSLRKAIELSQQTPSAVEDRGERERSVRASAPPPSPRRLDNDDEEAERLAFGPSNKDDLDGKLSLVPLSSVVGVKPSSLSLAKVLLADSQTSTAQANKEEEDIQRAIQESMMSASLHSVGSAGNDDFPPQTARAPGAPAVYITTSMPSYTAYVLQAIAAVPQIREVFSVIGGRDDDLEELQYLKRVLQLQDTADETYVDVNADVQSILKSWDLYTESLPPWREICDGWLINLSNLFTHSAEKAAPLIDLDGSLADYFRRPEQVLSTRLNALPHRALHVDFERTRSGPSNIHDQLASIVWSPDTPEQSIHYLADVVFVNLRRTPGLVVAPWQWDEHVTLDRYLTHNVRWAAQSRAEQGIVQGELRRLKEEIENLTSFRGNAVPDAIKTLINHLKSSPSSDDVQAESRAELTAKLERISEVMKARLEELQENVKEREEAVKGGVFNTNDPERNQHKYSLRAILWHDGFTTPGRHLYTYVKNNGEWWKVQDYEATLTNFEAIKSDSTGLFTDGGPALLIYSRDGPRPHEVYELSPSPESDSSLLAMTDAANSDMDTPTLNAASQADTLETLDTLDTLESSTDTSVSAHTASDAMDIEDGGAAAPEVETPTAAVPAPAPLPAVAPAPVRKSSSLLVDLDEP